MDRLEHARIRPLRIDVGAGRQADPSRSGVRGVPALSTAATANRTAAALLPRPRWSSSIPADRMAASGLAIPLPVMSGAEPWTGSNMLGYVLSGLMLALAARPMLPDRGCAAYRP